MLSQTFWQTGHALTSLSAALSGLIAGVPAEVLLLRFVSAPCHRLVCTARGLPINRVKTRLDLLYYVIARAPLGRCRLEGSFINHVGSPLFAFEKGTESSPESLVRSAFESVANVRTSRTFWASLAGSGDPGGTHVGPRRFLTPRLTLFPTYGNRLFALL